MNVSSFFDDDLDDDLAAVLAHDGVIDKHAADRSSAEQRRISLGYLLSSSQASTTIGFSLAIVFVASASLAFLYSPRGNNKIYPSNVTPTRIALSKSLEGIANRPHVTSKSSPTYKINTSEMLATISVRHAAHSAATDATKGKAVKVRRHPNLPDQYAAQAGTPTHVVDGNSPKRPNTELPQLAYTPDDVASRVNYVPRAVAPVVANPTTPNSEVLSSADVLATRTRRDSVTALRSFRRQW